MITITESITLSRPPADVFAFASDYRNDPRWRSGIVEMIQNPEGPSRPGTTTREIMQFFGQELVTVAEVVHLEPGREIAFRSTQADTPVQGYRRIEPVEGGTRLTYHLEAEPQGFNRLLAPVMQWTFRRQLRQDLEVLKGVVEQGTLHPAS